MCFPARRCPTIRAARRTLSCWDTAGSGTPAASASSVTHHSPSERRARRRRRVTSPAARNSDAARWKSSSLGRSRGGDAPGVLVGGALGGRGGLAGAEPRSPHARGGRGERRCSCARPFVLVRPPRRGPAGRRAMGDGRRATGLARLRLEEDTIRGRRARCRRASHGLRGRNEGGSFSVRWLRAGRRGARRATTSWQPSSAPPACAARNRGSRSSATCGRSTAPSPTRRSPRRSRSSRSIACRSTACSSISRA